MNKALKEELKKTSAVERNIAKWQFRRYPELIDSICLHKERGQGICDENEMVTLFQTDEDAIRCSTNERVVKDLEEILNQYVEIIYQEDVWDIAIGRKRLADIPDYDRATVKLEYVRLLNGYCKEKGLNTTVNLRKWGSYTDFDNRRSFLLFIAQSDETMDRKVKLWDIANGRKIFKDFDERERYELQIIFKSLERAWKQKCLIDEDGAHVKK